MGARSSQSRGPGLNETDGHLLEYFRNTFSAGGGGNSGPNIPVPPSGLTATGGVISDYTSGSDVYRAHVFTSSGALNVTALGSLGNTVEYLVVAGGGGGSGYSGYNGGGGGGAGGLRTNVPGVQDAGGNPLTGAAFPVSVSPYTVTVGAGGAFKPDGPAPKGVDSVFGSITSAGGGGGGYPAGTTGGSGGGGSATSTSVVAGNTPPSTPSQGNPGGHGNSNVSRAGGGGGGAGGAGETASGPHPGGIAGNGGVAVQVLIAGSPSNTQPVGTPGPSGTGWFAGGGGGAGADETFADTKRGVGGRGPDHSATTPYGGGGNGQPGGSPVAPQPNGLSSTGGGGGGGRSPNFGGGGGSGVVVVRYKIGSITANAKATGGAVSFYNSKTIHTFTTTGDFNNTSGANLTGCEVIVLGGGGGGGHWQAGAGGSGRFYRNDDVTIAPGPQSVTIGAGGQAGVSAASAATAVGSIGTNSVFNSVTMPGGGGGAKYDSPAGNGGSGGGGAGGPGNAGSAPAGNVNAVTNVDTPASGAGNAGANGQTAAPHGGGGGGGVGGSATAGSSGNGGPGGLGVQLPSTFRDPISSIGFLSNGVGHFVGGGGGGSAGPPAAKLAGGGGGAPQVPQPKQVANGSMPVADQATYMWAGAGSGMADGRNGVRTQSALENSGSGGGGNGSGYPVAGQWGGNGGSGIVLIAYPS